MDFKKMEIELKSEFLYDEVIFYILLKYQLKTNFFLHQKLLLVNDIYF